MKLIACKRCVLYVKRRAVMVIVQTSGVCHPSDVFNYCHDVKLQYRISVNGSAPFSLSLFLFWLCMYVIWP